MRAERMVLRAKHLQARKMYDGMISRLIAENRDLRKLVSELRAALEKHEDEGKLIRPATMSEASNILLSQSGATKESAKDVLVTK